MRVARNAAFLIMLGSLMLLGRPAEARDDDNCSDGIQQCDYFNFGPCSRSCEEMMELQCPNFCNACSNEEMDPELSFCFGEPSWGWCECRIKM